MHRLLIALIDDDYVDRTINRTLISLVSPQIRTIEFSGAMEALTYLEQNAKLSSAIPDIVVLDINMPIMSGWDYLDQYNVIGPSLVKQPRHYIYTSSIDPKDLNYQHENVFGNFTKPFDKETIREIIESGTKVN